MTTHQARVSRLGHRHGRQPTVIAYGPLLLAALATVAFDQGAQADVPPGYVCQLETPTNATLQGLMGVTCNVTESGRIANVSFCNCTSKYITGMRWIFVSDEINETLEAEPGHWFMMDESGRCVVATLAGPEPLQQPCPPGFYCMGGRDQPRSCSGGDSCPGGSGRHHRCPRGKFCPFPGGPQMDCPDGATCNPGSELPGPCEAGYFCKHGRKLLCPKDHYCPYATVDPRPCEMLTFCPEGSKSPGIWLWAFGLLVFAIGGYVATARYYEQVVQRGVFVTVAVALLLLPLWFMDLVLAGFLTLVFVAVAANWFLLRIGTCPWYVSHCLCLATLGLALIGIWYVNPPWSLLGFGLAGAATLGWIMSRQSSVLLWVGRLMLFLAFGLLIVAYIRTDKQFMLGVGAFVALNVIGLVFSFTCEGRRQGRRVRLPFQTRWEEGTGGLMLPNSGSSASLLEQGQQQGQQPPTTVRQNAPVAIPTEKAKTPTGSPTTTASTLGSVLPNAAEVGTPRNDVTGVSFRLEKLQFDLPDGKRLLRDINLYIRPGSRVAVMGPSGSGKTTLLAVLSGRASYGRVEGKLLVGGRKTDSGSLRFLQNVTGFVPQDDVLLGELTVEENIRFQAALRLKDGTSPAEIDGHVKQVAKDLKLDAILDSRVGTPEARGVSGGQRKRVSIAMELVAQPLLLFADEPTSGLDSTTSHEVVQCLNGAASRLGTTVAAVIHQPRYETLCLFDDLVLLGVGGCLTYAGPTANAMVHFRDVMRVEFQPNSNPADILLDAIQSPERFERYWQDVGPKFLVDELPVSTYHFQRQRVPFFRAMLGYMDRSMRQSFAAWKVILINQVLCMGTITILCYILVYERLDQFMMQSTLASLFVMLLNGVAAQRVFGADLLVTWREARVGMPMIAYFVAKDFAALFEVTLSAGVFAASYGCLSGMLQPLHVLFAGSWSFVYCVFGLGYVFSIVLSPGAAQMCAVVSSFVAFCMSGIYEPSLPVMASMMGGRGWMIPALSPIRWLYGYLLTHEATLVTPLTLQGASWQLLTRGYDTQYLGLCTQNTHLPASSENTLQQAWARNDGWVCSISQMVLLGIMFRYLAGICLILNVNAQTSGWARFFGQSEAGLWKLAGKLFSLLLCTFLALFFFAEMYVFGIVRLHVAGYVPDEVSVAAEMFS
eukprot:TRINITY_DN19684_c0_g1_i1.p1 TRINITY_DN19684_c0_g1~~TRINITY_DN19684_c0_g1_i1.p1  ORF type:complete len:1165 (+),score=190.46 TRINITY_DN19684_c0_g1_i1:56-3550(+)